VQKKLHSLPYYQWLIFGVVATGSFMATLTSSIVNVALPSITASLKTDLPTAQWVVTAYLLAITSLLPLMGRFGDVWGRRKIYGFGFLGFTAGSLLCSISPSIGILIAARIVQAVGAAALMANAPAIVTGAFPLSERGKVLGMIGTAVALGTLSGPSLGGVLVGTLGWHSIFIVNIPIGVIGYLGVWLILPLDRNQHRENIDYLGAALFTSGMISFLLVITHGAQWGWISLPSILSCVIALIAFTLFVHHEQKVPHPMIDLSIFRIWAFLAGNLSGVFSFMALFSNTMLLPFFLHDVLAYSPSQIGLIMSAFPLVMAITAPVSGTLSDKMGPVALTTTGLGLMALGLVITAYLQPASALWVIMTAQALMGLGNGLFQSPNNNSVMSAVQPNQLGIAGGINALARNLGMVCGTAISVSILENRRLAALTGIAFPTPDQQAAAFMSGYHSALIAGACFAILGALISMKRTKQ
jgi:EmrB/QacA subfamily drug resistance transporter